MVNPQPFPFEIGVLDSASWPLQVETSGAFCAGTTSLLRINAKDLNLLQPGSLQPGKKNTSHSHYSKRSWDSKYSSTRDCKKSKRGPNKWNLLRACLITAASKTVLCPSPTPCWPPVSFEHRSLPHRSDPNPNTKTTNNQTPLAETSVDTSQKCAKFPGFCESKHQSLIDVPEKTDLGNDQVVMISSCFLLPIWCQAFKSKPGEIWIPVIKSRLNAWGLLGFFHCGDSIF